MRLADDPTPADPLRPLIVDMDEEAASMVRRLLRFTAVQTTPPRAKSRTPL